MARQGNIKLRGTFDGIEFYEWNQVDCMRLKPKTNKQTRATKASAKIFGTASKVGNKMTNTFKPAIPSLLDNRSRNYFVRSFNTWLQTRPLNTSAPLNELAPVTGFQFNEQTSLNARLKLALSITRTGNNTLLLSVPAFDPVDVITAPSNTVTVEMRIVACSCDMSNTEYLIEKCSAKMNIQYVHQQLPAQHFELPVKAAPGNVSVVMVALKYTVNRKGNLFETNDMRWMPAGVISAFYN